MFSTSHYNQTFTRRTNKRISVSQMLYDIVIDWLYLLLTTFAIVVCLFVLHLVFFELDLPGMIVECARTIEHYFWTSIFLVCLMAVVTYDRLERQRRHRHPLGHYDNQPEQYNRGVGY